MVWPGPQAKSDEGKRPQESRAQFGERKTSSVPTSSDPMPHPYFVWHREGELHYMYTTSPVALQLHYRYTSPVALQVHHVSGCTLLVYFTT